MHRQALPQLEQIGFFDVRKDQVLLVGDADFSEGMAVGEIGNGVHLIGRGIPRHPADGLQ